MRKIPLNQEGKPILQKSYSERQGCVKSFRVNSNLRDRKIKETNRILTFGNAQVDVDPPKVVRLMCMGPGRIQELRVIIKRL